MLVTASSTTQASRLLTLHLSVSLSLSPPRQELLRDLKESNGNGSIPMVRSVQPNQPMEIASAANGADEEEDEDNGEEGGRDGGGRTGHTKTERLDVAVHQTGLKARRSGGRCVQSVKQASRRVAHVFSVENPHNIDRHSRTVFPAAFLVVNVLYWLYYLFL